MPPWPLTLRDPIQYMVMHCGEEQSVWFVYQYDVWSQLTMNLWHNHPEDIQQSWWRLPDA